MRSMRAVSSTRCWRHEGARRPRAGNAMIRYALVCDHSHEFESWFSSSASFEEQAKRGFVSCPACGSIRVERAIMAPNIARSDRGPGLIEAVAEAASGTTAPAQGTPAPAPVAAPLALMGEKEIAFRQMLVALHAHVAETAEHVGRRFADEALKIHHGESESRADLWRRDAGGCQDAAGGRRELHAAAAAARCQQLNLTAAPSAVPRRSRPCRRRPPAPVPIRPRP